MLDPVKLAEYLGVTQDARVTDAAAAASSWVEARRSVTDPVALWAGEDVQYGALLFGALLYQARVTPSGLPGYSDDPALFAQTTDALFRARELVGNDPVVA
jgi:hypothetical protein